MSRSDGWDRAPLVLGVDLGTSALKAVAVDAGSGRPLGAGTAAYATHAGEPGRAEQDPGDWWRAARAAVAGALGGDGVRGRPVAAIGVAGQMHGLVATDEGGTALARCQTWADVRAADEATAIEGRLGRLRAIALAGSRPDPAFTAAKALWLRRHEPRLLERARWLLLPKDWLRMQMTGAAATEPSDASGTGLLDVARRRWSAELCRAAGVDAGSLPPVVPSATVAGRLARAAAAWIGVAAGTPVAAGAGDAAAAALAAGVESGEGRNALASLGTAAQVYVRSSRPIVDPDGRLHTLCHPDPDSWGLMAAILSAGSALQWLADLLREPGASPRPLLRAAADVAAGADGLLFAPWLRGERTPYLDRDVRGAFTGLTLAHGPGHLARAVLEGVAFALRAGLDAMRSLGITPGSVTVTGGAARSRLWREILADVLELPVARLARDDASALGAARLAAEAVGFDVGAWRVRTRERLDPDPARVERYRGSYARYTRLYPSLRDL